MRRTLLFLASIPVCVSATAQVSDTVLTESLINNEWQKSTQEIISYNPDCSFNTTLTRSWDVNAGIWVNSSQWGYFYDEQGKVKQFLTQNWDVVRSRWVNNSRNLISEASPGVENSIQQNWSIESHSWITFSRTFSTYNNLGWITSSRTDLFVNGSWEPLYVFENTYDADNRQTGSRSQVWQNGAWVNSSKTTFVYGDVRQIINYYWDISTGTWKKSSRDISEYIPNTTVVQKSRAQNFTGTTWQNTTRSSYQYFVNNGVYQQTYLLSENWDGGINRWINFFDVSTNYYQDGAVLDYTFRLWDPGANTWGTTSRTTFIHNNSCNLSLKAEPVALKDLPNKLQQQNAAKQVFNVTASDKGKLQYELFINKTKDQKTYLLQLTLSAAKNKSISSINVNSIKVVQSKTLIAPNPAKSYLNINIGSAGNTEAVTIKLSDISGKTVLQQKLIGNGIQKIMLPSLPKGIYFVSVISGKQVENKKIMIE